MMDVSSIEELGARWGGKKEVDIDDAFNQVEWWW